MSIRTEEFIVANTVRNAIRAGFAIRVNDGEWLYQPCRDLEQIMRDATATEETTLLIVSVSDPSNVLGAIYFVYGNDIDILTDYSDNPLTESMLCSVENLAKQGIEAGWL